MNYNVEFQIQSHKNINPPIYSNCYKINNLWIVGVCIFYSLGCYFICWEIILLKTNATFKHYRHLLDYRVETETF